MPRDGPLILTDVRGPILVILCEACERRGRYNVERLMAQHGNAKLTDLLFEAMSRQGWRRCYHDWRAPLRRGLRPFPTGPV